jgi:glycosyltransferase involved in cell wall biosynthesis
MKLTLIITTYNWPESLLKVIESIRRQSIPPDEIVVADDGSNNKTKDLIANINKEFAMNIIHSWQEDIGFRVARSRNKAILKSSGDYIVLIDGDIILHPNFIKDHLDFAEPGYFIQGTRALLSKKGTIKILDGIKVSFSFFSSELKNRKNAINSKYLSLIFSSKTNHFQGIKSCNLAFYKQDCLNINGFNNDFKGWGREDSEFVVRLLNNGIKRKNVRFHANQFHLWHNENSRKTLVNNNKILDNAIKSQKKWCKNGINSLVNNES